jgi:hypothetical protein
MIVNSPKFINLPDQSGNFAYLWDISLSNTTGELSIGFSGEGSNILNFHFENGEVYDTEDHFIYGYLAGQSNSFYGIREGSQHAYFINGKPIKLNGLTDSAQPITSFYVNPSNLTANLTFRLSGDYPTFDLSEVSFDGTNPTGTGYVANNGTQSIQFYSGESPDTDYTIQMVDTGVITPASSGVIRVVKNFNPLTSTDFSPSRFPISYLFYTNFGQTTGNLSGFNNFPISQTFSLDFQNSFSGVGTFTNFLNWENLQGDATYVENSLPISFALYRDAGAGVFNSVFNVQTGLIGQGFVNLPFDAPNQTFSGDFDSVGASGIGFRIIRVNPTGQQLLRLEVQGFSSQISFNITGN